jgi:Zn finger protein HypA/HybF involved in hydrogenase expression
VAGESRDPVAAARRVGRRTVALVRRLVGRAIAPLTAADGPGEFRLSIPETHTTTLDGDTGWSHRPPARLRCPECRAEIHQADPRSRIDCPRCAATYPPDRFPDLELVALICPTCRRRMRHGRRHPEAVDVPEWATCDGCRYHWEFQHFY